MLKEIINRELYTQITSLRLLIVVAISAMLIVFTTLVGIHDYKLTKENYDSLVNQSEEELITNRVYSTISPKSIKPPALFSIFDKGYQEKMQSVFKTDPKEPFVPNLGYSSEYSLLWTIMNIDIITIVNIFFTLIAILLGYDVICSEKETGILKLALTSGVSKRKYLFGKVVAHLLVLLLIIIINVFVSVIIVMISIPSSLNVANIITALSLCSISIIYLLIFYLGGIFFSVVTDSQLFSLLACVLVWVLIIFVYPNLTKVVVNFLNPIQQSEYIRVEKETNRLQEPIKKFHVSMSGYFKVDYISGSYRIQVLSPDQCKVFAEFIRESEPIRLSINNKIEKLYDNLVNLEYEQYGLLTTLGIISPSFTYNRICEILCGVSVENFLHFRTIAKQYKENVLKYFYDNKVYESLRYFTIMSQDDLENFRSKVIPRWEKIYSDHGKFGTPLPSSEMEIAEPLYLKEFPRFQYSPLSGFDKLNLILLNVIWLLLLNFVLFVSSLIVFEKREVA